LILLHDNARPHVAKPVKKYLKGVKWEILSHPPYSSAVAPSDFHLFRSMQLAFLKNDSILTKKNISKNGLMNGSFQKNQISSFKESFITWKMGESCCFRWSILWMNSLYIVVLNKYIFFIKKGRKLILIPNEKVFKKLNKKIYKFLF